MTFLHIYLKVSSSSFLIMFALSYRHVKEGSTVTVMGVLQRHENVLMIVPPPGPVSTGCQWSKALLPGSMEGLIMRCQEVNKVDGIPL
jgi:hypothetical protein